MSDNKFGPTRGELRFRFFASLAGLALMGVAFAIVGFPKGPAFFETVLIAGGFFGGTAIWSGIKLWKG